MNGAVRYGIARNGTAALSDGQSGCGTREADVIPAIAASSSLSDVSPETPTQPSTTPASSLTSTPPGTGTSLPPMGGAAEVKKEGCCSARGIREREPMPSASAPYALP